MKPLVVAVLGPTATGKSALALAIAEQHGGEIINCDSTAGYRGFDIGTDKIALSDRRGIRHHLIDIAEPTDDYTAAQYDAEKTRGLRAMSKIARTAPSSSRSATPKSAGPMPRASEGQKRAP